MKVKKYNSGYLIDDEFLQSGSTSPLWTELQEWLKSNEAEPEFTEAETVQQALDKQMSEAKAYLAATDFKVLPDYDKEPTEVIAKRAEAREFIRANQGVQA